MAISKNKHLLKSSVLRGLTNKDYELLSRGLSWTELGKKHLVFQQGTIPRGAHWIQSGRVKVYCRDRNGKEVILDILGEGGLLGVPALVASSKYFVSAETIEEAQIGFLEKVHFFDLLESSPRFSRNVHEYLGDQVRARTDLVCSFLLKTVRERIARALLMLNEKASGKWRVLVRREDLASFAGTTLESAVRCLSEFKKEGWIEIEGREIVVLKGDELTHLADCHVAHTAL